MMSNALCYSCLHCTSITEGKKMRLYKYDWKYLKILSVNPVKNSKHKETP